MPWAPAGLVQGSILLAAHNDTARDVSWTIAVGVDAELRLGQVLAGRGWRGRPAGEDGAAAAWLLAQHANDDPTLQQKFLEALRAAVAAGDASAAYLEDRVRVNAGQPQLYGTRFTVTEAGFGPRPIVDPDRLDVRRAAVGLEPFAVYDAQLRAGT